MGKMVISSPSFLENAMHPHNSTPYLFHTKSKQFPFPLPLKRKCAMLNPAGDLLPPASSPTISSISSSSDLESASTGSFFHDRSTTLGTLMGVTFPPSFTFNALPPPTAAAAEQEPDDEDDDLRRRRLPKRRRRWWWGLCGDDLCCGGGGGGVGDSRRRSSASLAEFLEVERRLGEALYGEGSVGDTRVEERGLFRDGRVLPPPGNRHGDVDGDGNGVGAFRFPVLVGGLCSRGVA